MEKSKHGDRGKGAMEQDQQTLCNTSTAKGQLGNPLYEEGYRRRGLTLIWVVEILSTPGILWDDSVSP